MARLTRLDRTYIRDQLIAEFPRIAERPWVSDYPGTWTLCLGFDLRLELYSGRRYAYIAYANGSLEHEFANPGFPGPGWKQQLIKETVDYIKSGWKWRTQQQQLHPGAGNDQSASQYDFSALR